MSYTTPGTGYAKYNAAFRLLMSNGWIVDQYNGNDMSYEVRTTDIVTMGDATNWLAKQTN